MLLDDPSFKIWLVLLNILNSGFAKVTHSYKRLHFIVQNVRRTCMVTGQFSIWSCIVYIVNCIVNIYKFTVLNCFNLFFRDSLLSIRE